MVVAINAIVGAVAAVIINYLSDVLPITRRLSRPICLNCGKLNPEGFNYCLECGAEIHPEKEHSAESNFLAGLSAESPEIKKLKEEIESQKANASQPRHGDSVIELTPEFDEPVIKAQISPN
ncbi:MAG TPA: zinc ribbon domain-containing protein, partial [Anaerolineaceae bacterium]|nr:zinc ribbon domain-containing protein [Anaerolineaceae bacterium]